MKSNPQPPESASSTLNPLEALLSPQDTSFDPDGPNHARASIAESVFNDIALDDEALSPVALSSRQSLATLNLDSDVLHDNPPPDLSHREGMHKKSASTTTIRSIHNLPFLMARLETQEETGQSNRVSLDGQHKLQEEFARLQKEGGTNDDATRHGMIDWGASGLE